MTPEQVRRAGDPAGAVDLCRDALARFPGHLSARVTLGWALLDLGRLHEAREEFQIVRQSAPDNFAAIRGLAQLHVLDENDNYASDTTIVDLPPEPTVRREAPPEPALAQAPAVAAVEVPAPVFQHAPELPQVKMSPVVMRLEAWLSRVEALKAAV